SGLYAAQRRLDLPEIVCSRASNVSTVGFSIATESTNDRVLPKYKAVKTIASAVVLLTCYGSALAQAPSATLAGTRPSTSSTPETANLPGSTATSPSSPSAASSPVPEVAPPTLTDLLSKN